MATRPGRVAKIIRRGADGAERTVFVGVITEEIPEGDHIRVNARSPEFLVTDHRDLPFPQPLHEYVREPKGFGFWWKQLDYVFGLPDPQRFPRLPEPLSATDSALAERFVYVATQLAASALLNAVGEGFTVNVPDPATSPEEIQRQFSGTDVHTGFAGLIRLCDSPKERASFHRVHRIVWLAAKAAGDDLVEHRLQQLTAWRNAVAKLHRKSLNQLVREKLAEEEGMTVFAYDEEHAPEELLSIHNYGDLLHYDEGKSSKLEQWRRDPVTQSDRRMAYLMAAAGLGHVYIGFGELARSALGQANKS